MQPLLISCVTPRGIKLTIRVRTCLQDRDGAGFYYPQNDIDDIANDDNLDDAAELKKGRSISSHGFNFDYAEGSDEHFGTAQRRITMRRKTQSSSSLRASQRPVTSSIDLDAGLLEQSTEKDEEKEKENELMNDPSCKGKCYRMGLDVMNQTLPAWQPVVVVKWTATTLVRSSFNLPVGLCSNTSLIFLCLCAFCDAFTVAYRCLVFCRWHSCC